MTFEIFKAFPPDHETPIAELWVHHDGVVDIPAQICRESDTAPTPTMPMATVRS
jgi:hypothetical protein